MRIAELMTNSPDCHRKAEPLEECTISPLVTGKHDRWQTAHSVLGHRPSASEAIVTMEPTPDHPSTIELDQSAMAARRKPAFLASAAILDLV